MNNLKGESLTKFNRNTFEKQSLKDRDNYIYIQTCTMLKFGESGEKEIRRASERLGERFADEEMIPDTINKVFSELIVDAYSDRTAVYLLKVDNNFSDMEKIQATRQKADNHLIRLIRAFVDIKRPPIKVFVRKLDQLNVSDKQININQKKANDLDKNNEKNS